MKISEDLGPSSPLAFLGLQLERDAKNDDLIVHQRTFVTQLLQKYGLELTGPNKAKGVSAVVAPVPNPETERPPTLKELRDLQAAAGELNWLATRTRADLGYFASVLASGPARYAEWCEDFFNKVLRYLVKTHDAGLRFPRAGREQNLQCWTDAGYGGEGTKGQSGVLVAWAGAVILWRSSKQSTSSLSTCECEVGAAALGFQIVEGLRALLDEWGVRLDPPALYQDNQSALTVIEQGGTWRTRYFATRASRLSEEHKLKTIILHYCPTKLMAADGLTKLSTAETVSYTHLTLPTILRV